MVNKLPRSGIHRHSSLQEKLSVNEQEHSKPNKNKRHNAIYTSRRI